MSKRDFVDFGRSPIVDGDWYGWLCKQYLTDETAWEIFPGAADLAKQAIEREEMEERDFMEWLGISTKESKDG